MLRCQQEKMGNWREKSKERGVVFRFRLHPSGSGGTLPRPEKQKIQIPEWVSGFFGTPEGTRTPNPRNRNPMLYPLSHRRVLVDSLNIIAGFFQFVKG